MQNKKDSIKKCAIPVLLCVILESVFLVSTFYSVKKQVKTEASAKAEELAAIIQTELYQGLETTELLKDLYKVYGKTFLQDFSKICNELVKNNLAIGSMYFAPNGYIKYSFPAEVDSATQGFNMMDDPIQGPKAIKAKEERKATIAGPHNLIEGGQGFIIRNPVFNRDEFEAFSILVLDKKSLDHKILQRIGNWEYDFAVWKDFDETAVLDDNGFIFTSRSNGKAVSREVFTSISILNDTWYIALEPKNGWNVLGAMKLQLLMSLIIFFILQFVIFTFMQAQNRKRQLQMEIFANQAKSKFLFSMSHDIRTPMNAIIGFADLMKKNLDNREKLENYLEKIHYSSKFLLSLINNVLEMARIESGKMILEENIINTKRFEDITEAVFMDQANEKGIVFSNEYHFIHEYLIGDEMKLRELTLNIVSNAIKYTNPGGFVKLYLEETPSNKPGYAQILAIAEDSGIGISPEFLPHIFEEFSRERTSTESKVIGTGLGMPIVKKLVDCMDGSIDIQSKLGKGTTITVHLLLKIPTQEQVDFAQKKETLEAKMTDSSKGDVNKELFKGKRLLLAEDNNLNAEIAISILEEMGFFVSRAENGAQCVQFIEDSSENPFDLVIMDIQMPVMNGYQATQSIRSLKNKDLSSIPIIAMTANAFEEDRKKAYDAGMNGHVAKPINVSELALTISRILGNSAKKANFLK